MLEQIIDKSYYRNEILDKQDFKRLWSLWGGLYVMSLAVKNPCFMLNSLLVLLIFLSELDLNSLNALQGLIQYVSVLQSLERYYINHSIPLMQFSAAPQPRTPSADVGQHPKPMTEVAKSALH